MKSKDKVVEYLKTTPIVQVACQKAGISRATYYRWREIDHDFKIKADLSLIEGAEMINDLAESQLINLIKDKSVAAIMYWLNHHHYKYNERRLLLTNEEKTQLMEIAESGKKSEAIKFIIKKIAKGDLADNFSPEHLLKLFEDYGFAKDDEGPYSWKRPN